MSDRICKRFGKDFTSIAKTLDDFEKFTKSNSVDRNYHISRNFHEKGDQFFNYTIHWEGKNFLINELSWVNHHNDTFHSVLNFLDRNNIFEVSLHALVEIIEKMENPAISPFVFSMLLTMPLRTTILSTLGVSFNSITG